MKLGCVLLFVVFATVTALWLAFDRTPPRWDDAWYLAGSLRAYDALAAEGILGYLRKLNTVFGFKAPLIAALPAPFYLLLGRRWHAAFLVNLGAMAVLFLALYRIASRWWSKRAALLSIAIAGTMPLLYGLARWYMVEYVAAAAAAAAVCMMEESDRLARRGIVVLLGAVFGLGLLLKVLFPVYLLPAFVYVWLKSRDKLRTFGMAALPCLGIALPWYVGHWRPVLANAFDAAYGGGAVAQGTGQVFSISAIAAYLSNVMSGALSVYWVAVGAALALWAVARPGITNQTPRLLVLWIAPFLVFLFGGNKDVRYLAPILPAVALAVAGLLDRLLQRNTMGAAAGVLVLAYPTVQMFAVSFGVPYRAPGIAYAQPFRRENWRHDEMIQLIASQTPTRNRLSMVLVGSDRAGLNANNIELTAVALRAPLLVETTAHEPDRDTLMARLEQADFFVFKDGGEPESPYFNPHFAAVVERVCNSRMFAELPYGRPLPDGGIARIFRRSGGGPEPPPQEFAIDFGKMITLTAAQVEQTPDAVTVRYGWQWTQPPALEYWSFTHAVDQAGKIVTQLDRPVPAGESGKTLGQEIRLRIPAATRVRLRFGVYAPATGKRLPIGPLPASITRLRTAEDGTAITFVSDR